MSSFTDKIRMRTAHSTLSRSPRPYRRKSISVHHQHPTDSSTEASHGSLLHTSDSSEDYAAEADDEKGPLLRLPAPTARPHKGLKGVHDPSLQLTPAESPALSPSKDLKSFITAEQLKDIAHSSTTEEEKPNTIKYRKTRRAEVVRRLAELLLLLVIFAIQWFNTCQENRRKLAIWKHEFISWLCIVTVACLSLPFRRSWTFWKPGTSLTQALKLGFGLPARFDSGTVLYPLLLPLLVMVSLQSSDLIVPVNLLLSLSTLPAILFSRSLPYLPWMASLLPITNLAFISQPMSMLKLPHAATGAAEEISLIYCLHRDLIDAISRLTTTSLDAAEIHLMSIGLINLLLYSNTAQSQILKALLWVGGLCLYVSCESALKAEVALARIPAWRFARNRPQSKGIIGRFNRILRAIVPESQSRFAAIASSGDEDETSTMLYAPRKRHRPPHKSVRRNNLDRTMSADERVSKSSPSTGKLVRSSTFSTFGRAARLAIRWRNIANRSNPYLQLNYLHAQAAKLGIAVYVYSVLALVILLPVRCFIDTRALNNREAIGWALGYFFGDLAPFRIFVVSNDLDRWIMLPTHKNQLNFNVSHGWIDDYRQHSLGAANTRLFLAAYCVLTVIIGIVVVLRLKQYVEVDTRRKVFHGVMVAMLVPTIPVDPCFFALALMIVLAVFLMLDLIRASQIPPISRPLTTFLAPYVDGRDHRGPVVVSHIFLLIGCAIPLWLSLVNADRAGEGSFVGWDVKTRDVSMASGVVCVGMGDAAASLVGRRYGRTKWYWGGGKSLEGSAAFSFAVIMGLLGSWLWLCVGGWMTFSSRDFWIACLKSSLAGMGASLMESTLTAANDNVVVPIGLWLLVRGLRI